MKRLFLYISVSVLLLCSCSKHDYRASIPSGSVLVASVDLTNKDAAEDLGFLTNLLKMDDPKKCGIDVSEKIYFFESADGNFGMCAKVADTKYLNAYSDKLIKSGLMKAGPERDDCKFAIIADKFVAGWDDATFMIMGPVLTAGQKDMMQQIASLFEQDESDSMLDSPLMEKLHSQSAPISIVAQTTALPEQIASIFTIGAPKDVEPSHIAFVADLDIHDNMLVIESEPFSDNNAADEYIKKSYSVFRQIGDSYLQNMDNHDLLGLFINVEGKKFLPLLQQSTQFQTLLAGVNQAIDMNAIIKSINGDMYIGMPEYSQEKPSITLAAKLGQSNFLQDIDYWKKSAPSGVTISDWKDYAFQCHSEDINFYFGVQNYTPLQFYASTDRTHAEQVLKVSENPISDEVVKTIKGKRLAAVMSLASLLPSDGGMAMLMLPSLMKVKYIVYTVK